MMRRVSWAFLGVSVAFFLFMVGLTGYRLEDTRTRNSALVQDRHAALVSKVASIQSAFGGFDGPAARKELRGAFAAEPRLLLMCVHSPSEGILYLIARNKAYLKDPETPSPEWRGTPVYDVNSGYETALSKLLGEDPQGPVLDAEFVILGREDLYPIVRDDLYLFLAFLLVSGVVILIAVSVQEEPGERERSSQRPSAGAGVDRGDRGGPHSLVSERTGLIHGEHLESRLRYELEKAASPSQEVALARIRIDEPFADSRLPVVYPEIAGMMLRTFPVHDCLFDTGIDSFAILLPDTDILVAVRTLDSFRRAVIERPIEGRIRTLSIGVSSKAGRAIASSTLLEEADVSLAKAAREGGNQVVGFQADPSRYHESIGAAR